MYGATCGSINGLFQESRGDGMALKSRRLGSYATGNASRDFYRNVKLPLDCTLKFHVLNLFKLKNTNCRSQRVKDTYP